MAKGPRDRTTLASRLVPRTLSREASASQRRAACVWKLHAVNCRSNHCHTVVTAMDHDGEQVRDQFKSWCARAMKAHQREHKTEDELVREHWWTRKGSVRYLFDEESLEASIRYTLESQESGGSKLDC
jgi:REP element-mobilizing transposase RayT